MGLPTVIIDFESKAKSIITRSARGVALLILKDNTADKDAICTYTSAYDPNIETDWSADNQTYINQCFLGGPNKVICVREKTGETLATLLTGLVQLRFNYLAMPEASTTDNTAIKNWIETKRNTDKRTFKAVLANTVANSFGIINFTTGGIVVGDETYTAAEYTARIAGILAGIGLDRSATYYVLDEVQNCTLSTDPDSDINAGKLIIVNDGEKFKIGRAVNSKTTIGAGETNDMKSIKIMEGIDLIRDDIRNTFSDNYVGKVVNSFDNKQLFVSDINKYFDDIKAQGVLFDAFDSYVEIDVEAQKSYLESKGVKVDDMTVDELKAANTGSEVFLSGRIQLQNAMEDLTLKIEM